MKLLTYSRLLIKKTFHPVDGYNHVYKVVNVEGCHGKTQKSQSNCEVL